MRFNDIPLCSSREVIAALLRLGAYPGKATRGSHASYHRQREDGRILTGVVVLNKREMPKGTLRRILDNLEIPPQDFIEAL